MIELYFNGLLFFVVCLGIEIVKGEVGFRDMGEFLYFYCDCCGGNVVM